MKSLFSLIVISFSLSSFSSNIENGKKIYQSCVQCHGQDGLGIKSEAAPAIKGQHAWYIESSIKAFKLGKDRKNPKMLPFIQKLSASDIQDVAAYVSQM